MVAILAAGVISGLDEYVETFPDAQIFDLYQNPSARPRKGGQHCQALTTGCSRLYIPALKRFAHGVELLLWHSIPVNAQVSNAMKCAKISVAGLSHRAMCSVAGNSMHAACIGLPLLCVVLFTRSVCN